MAAPFTTHQLLLFAFVVSLIAASYFFGAWQPSAALFSSNATPPCTNSSSPAPPHPREELRNSSALDFSVHHGANESEIAPLPAVVRRYAACSNKLVDYTPCEGQRWALKFPRKRLEYRERHCPTGQQRQRCLVPAPAGYRTPFRWPESRGAAWFANIPHEHLVEEKGVQNWIMKDGDVFRFPGGGTMFPHGADEYISRIGEVIDLAAGTVRTAVDTGCGVASWGAYLLSRGVVTMSIAPKDTHEAQVQFALERGVPAMIGILATKRLPYPSRSFDMAHCSRCLIPWSLYDGLYLIEIDRILRPGGYWILSGPPINWRRHISGWGRTEEDLVSEESTIGSITASLCWTKVRQDGDIAIWRKPINHASCKASATLNFCASGQDPDSAWYTKMQPCITPLPAVSNPDEVAGGQLKPWPERLTSPPPRITNGNPYGVSVEIFVREAEAWRRRVARYKEMSRPFSERGRYRNILDMNAGIGGFAAALIDDPVWVMNVVPTIANDTLGIIYERGIIGTYQDWCEAMSTYPRTYDLIHADNLFSLYKDRCEMEDIVLEMDRILRPGGSVIVRDDVDAIVAVKSYADGMQWESLLFDHEDSPLRREKLLVAVKSHWVEAGGRR